jgi:hypothetical protein
VECTQRSRTWDKEGICSSNESFLDRFSRVTDQSSGMRDIVGHEEDKVVCPDWSRQMSPESQWFFAFGGTWTAGQMTNDRREAD